MAKRIRLADLATHAGVSTATVSRVLNGKHSVAPDTRQAVLAALDLLGYERPEQLRERTGGLIGLILPELTNPIFPQFAQHLENAMTIQGYTPLLGAQIAGGATEDSYVEAMLEHSVDGLIFVSGLHADATASIERYHRITALGVPYVTMNGFNTGLSAPDFSTDDASAIRQAVRHLVGLGHRKIGLATGPLRFGPARVKTETFIDTMSRALPHEHPYRSHTLFTVEGGVSACTDLISKGCTAIIFASDIMAYGAIRYCQSSGLQIPDDLSIVGFDDSPLNAFTNPPLTTLHQPVKTMCETAVTTLLGMINGTQSPIGAMKFEPELIVRESTSSPRR
ncbi:LacI family DNA-binding transcriptional regulator [Arcanobacterium phocisimile]|uniref:LacI family DNA-binding transcriptional regulator n=1 Tax=Arcanobacterium phocisimile TaxID=1302235 RepID=A0ABX7IHA8_9ACTO|nr:LacI family DNA-binding transcriptional regulator [Arcanobacterium phocisimile]QRV02523.1 LacI family DNA-binding transcriptional regulator [Arcanobacterium phocisimile]